MCNLGMMFGCRPMGMYTCFPCHDVCSHPPCHRAALQLACDAPTNSLVSMHANAMERKPDAVLVTKEADWSPCIATLRGHSGGVCAVACTPDGTKIVSASWDKTIRVWDAANGELIMSLVVRLSRYLLGGPMASNTCLIPFSFYAL